MSFSCFLSCYSDLKSQFDISCDAQLRFGCFLNFIMCVSAGSVKNIFRNKTSCSSILISSYLTVNLIRSTFCASTLRSVTRSDPLLRCKIFPRDSGSPIWLMWEMDDSRPVGKLHSLLLTDRVHFFQVTFRPDSFTAEVHDENIRGVLKVRANMLRQQSYRLTKQKLFQASLH